MPIANKYDLKEVLDACHDYYEQTGRRITFEYSLVGGVNDTKQDAEELTKLIGKFPCHVNLIPVNPIKERDFVQPNKHSTNNTDKHNDDNQGNNKYAIIVRKDIIVYTLTNPMYLGGHRCRTNQKAGPDDIVHQKYKRILLDKISFICR